MCTPDHPITGEEATNRSSDRTLPRPFAECAAFGMVHDGPGHRSTPGVEICWAQRTLGASHRETLHFNCGGGRNEIGALARVQTRLDNYGRPEFWRASS